MNKEQQRAFEKFARDRGTKASTAHALGEIMRKGAGATSEPILFEEGEKAKINLELVKGRKNYPLMSAAYKKFVEENADTVFTVHKDKGREHLISFSEAPQWLFWSGDLLKYKED